MKTLKLGYFALAIAVSLTSFTLGFRKAQGSPARLDDVALVELEDRTRMTLTLDENIKIGASFDREKKTLSLKFADTILPDYLKELVYSDKIIESLTVLDAIKEGADKRPPTLKLQFKNNDVSFMRATGNDGLVTFIFKTGDRPIKISGVSASEFEDSMKRRAPEIEDQPIDSTLSPIESAATKIMRGITAEEADRRFADIDKIYGEKELRAGRTEFVDFMKQMQTDGADSMLAAIGMGKKFLAKYPDSVYREKVFYLLADANYKMAKYNRTYVKKALDAYSRAISSFPQSVFQPEGLMRRAALYRKQEFYIEALTEYGALLQSHPKGKYAVPAMLSRSDIYLKQKKFQRAQNELEKILVLYPNRREVRDVKYLIGALYHNRGRYEMAFKIFESAMKQWPTYPKTHPATFLKIANSRYQLGMKDGAAADYLTISNLFPQNSEGRTSMLRLADIKVETDNERQGARLYEKIIRKYPKNDEAVLATLRLASLGIEKPDLLKRSSVFDYSAFLNPMETFDKVFKDNAKKHSREILIRKGKALLAQKRYLSSILAMKELLRRFPLDRMSDEVITIVQDNLVNLIDVYHSQEGFFTALLTYYENFDPFLRDIENSVVLAQIADSYEAMSLYDRAIDYYRLSARYDKSRKSLPELAYKIVKATYGKGDYERSTNMTYRYLKEFPQSEYSTAARHLLGKSLYDSGAHAKAATEWRIALEADPNYRDVSETAYLMGGLYKKDRYISQSVDAYNLAIDSYQVHHPNAKGAEPPFIKDSFYQLAEALYLGGNYPEAIKSAQMYLDKYPDDKRGDWMEYLISASLAKIDKDEEAIASLKELSEKDKTSLIGKVAASRLDTFKWKNSYADSYAESE